MSEGVPKTPENVESLDKWRRLKAKAPEAVESMLNDEDYGQLEREEKMEALKRLMAIHGAMHEGTREPVNNENRFIVEILSQRMHELETEGLISGREAEAVAA